MSAGAATVAKLIALSPPPPAPGGGWTRNNLELSTPPKRVLGRLPGADQLLPFLANAANSGEVFKAFGDGWGMSDAAVSHDWLAPMADSFDEVLHARGAVCRFAGGTRIKTLNAALGMAASLTNAPGFDELTFVGTMSMGGHGSGLAIGPLAEQVRSLEMICVDRRRSPYTRTFTPGDPFFPAVITSLGALGVITDVTIAIEPPYFIDETRELLEWNQVKSELPNLFQQQKTGELHSIEIWVNPYLVSGKVWCVLGKRKKSTGPASGQRGWAVTHGTREQFEALAAVMRAFPAIIPRLLDGALAGTTSTSAVMPSAVGLDFGTPNLAPVIASECAVDVTTAVATVDALVAGIQARATNSNLWVTSPLGLRFVAAGRALLAPAYGRDTCTIEMPLLLGTDGAADTLTWFVRDMVPHGRPHWGQWNPLSGDELGERYPADALRDFSEALVELDPCGVFANGLVQRVFPDVPRSGAPIIREPLLPGDGCNAASVRSYSRLFCDPQEALRLDVNLIESPEPLLELLAAAKNSGQSYTSRGTGYAMHTQSIRQPDADFEYLTVKNRRGGKQPGPIIRVDANAMQLTVSADATWHAIVHETLPHGLLPKVVVTAPNATVGGTLASNSIGQTSRRFGHEADGLVSVTIAVPGDAQTKPYLKTMKPPTDPGDTSADALLFRAVIRGFGMVGVIVGATYQLMSVPADTQLPPVDACRGTGGASAPGPRCVAQTDVEAFTTDGLSDALSRLPPAPGTDDIYRSCVLFHTTTGWVARVTSTQFVSAEYGPHLITYEGDDSQREVAEVLLSTIPTSAVADLIAAKITENGKTGYHDPACGYLFTMLANEAFKKRMLPVVSKVMAPTVQMTFVIPEDRALQFLQGAFKSLIILKDDAPTNLNAARDYLAGVPDLFGRLADIERQTRQSEAQYLNLRDDSTLTNVQAVSMLMQRVLGLSTLVPALFEMIWIPADHQLLSSSYGQSGIAISLTFQGPGVNFNGELEKLDPFSMLKRNVYRALHELSAAATSLGGQVHLTKNVFVMGDPSAPAGSFFKSAFGARLDDFIKVRAMFDQQAVLSSRFAKEVLGL